MEPKQDLIIEYNNDVKLQIKHLNYNDNGTVDIDYEILTDKEQPSVGDIEEFLTEFINDALRKAIYDFDNLDK